MAYRGREGVYLRERWVCKFKFLKAELAGSLLRFPVSALFASFPVHERVGRGCGLGTRLPLCAVWRRYKANSLTGSLLMNTERQISGADML